MRQYIRKPVIQFFVICSLLLAQAIHSQSPDDLNLKRNLYFISVLFKNSQATEILSHNKLLDDYFNQQKQLIKIRGTGKDQRTALLNSLEWQTDTTGLILSLADVYKNSKSVFDKLINKELKPSGYYYRFNDQSNKDFFLNCWRETFKGINTIIDHYGFNKNFRYRSIDSASYNINSEEYAGFLSNCFADIDNRAKEMKLFFEPSLAFALDLMKVNNRYESANSELMEARENKKAIAQILKTKFDSYQYAAILVPGQGPELADVALDPVGKTRCDLAAKRYKEKLAPFIIVSGGNVHPFHTIYTEALEMKKYLVSEDSIPESAIIIEPQARHTTTNFRNAARLMIRYNMPVNKIALCVSTKDQIDYIMNDGFDQRNLKELGYVPYKNNLHKSTNEVTFYIVKDCLQIDPVDPLDP